MIRFTSALLVALLLSFGIAALAPSARAAETYNIRPAFKPGMSMTSTTDTDMKNNITYTMAGQPPQQAAQHMNQKAGWTVEVVKVDPKTGKPSAIKVKFDADAGGLMEMNGQRQEMPNPFAGKTVNVEMDELGILTHDAQTNNPAEDQQLKQILTGNGVIYAPKPVAVGDSWDADAQEVAKQFGLAQGDTGTVKNTLTRVENVGGRQVAVINTVVSMRQHQGPLEVQMTAKGPVRVDLATGAVLSVEISGTTNSAGKMSGPGPDGNPVEAQVEGKGTVTIKNSSKVSGAGASPAVAAAGDDSAPAPAPAPADGGGGGGGDTDANALPGKYEGDGITLTLFEQAGRGIVGELSMGDQKFPVEVSQRGATVKGTFSSGADKFPFTATPGPGGTLKFDSDGNVYNLKKKTNPLAKPKKPNPLAQPRSEVPAAPAAEQAPARVEAAAADPAPAPAAPAAGGGKMLRFERYVLKDDQIIPGEACSFLIPAGWKVTGGIKWRENIYYPYYVDLVAANPDGPEALTIIPTIPCIWSAQPMIGFPEGSLYGGSLVKRPTEPADFIKQIVVGRLRSDLQKAEVVKVEELPDVAKAAQQNVVQEAGIQKTCRAARIRFKYEREGTPVEEDVYCTMTYAAGQQGYVSMIQDAFFTLRAKAGELDDQARLLAVIQSSIRPNMNWFNRLTQMIQIAHQQGMQRIQAIGEWSKMYAQTSSQISDTITKSYWDRQASQARTSKAFSNSIRGVEQYQDHLGYSYELPSGYDNAWVNNRGEVLVSNEAGFDPGVTFKEDWHALTRQ